MDVHIKPNVVGTLLLVISANQVQAQCLEPCKPGDANKNARPPFPLFDRSHAERGNASRDALRPVTRSDTGCIPKRNGGMIIALRGNDQHFSQHH